MPQLLENGVPGLSREEASAILSDYIALTADCDTCDFKNVSANAPYQYGWLDGRYRTQYLPDEKTRENVQKAIAEAKDGIAAYHSRSRPNCRGTLGFRRL